MKYHLSILFLLISLKGFSQIRRFEISAGIGNNNQIESVLNEYYYPTDGMYVLSESKNAEAKTFKYNISAIWHFNDRYSLRLKYGHSKLENSYYYSDETLSGDFTMEQIVTNVNPAFCVSYQMGRLNFSTGIEFALFKVKEFKMDLEGFGSGYYQNTPFTNTINSDLIIDGGKITGINNFLELEFSATSRIGIGASASYGMMFTNFDGNITEKTIKVYDPNSIISSSYYHNSEEKKYKKRYFSAPEVSIFVFLRFGKAVKTI